MNSLLTEIKKVADQIRGVTYGANDAIDKPQNGYIGLLRANNIQNNCLNFDDLLYVPSHKVSNLQILKRGDILIAASSGSLSIVGKAGVFKSDEKYTFGAFCKAIRPRTNIDASYLSHYFFTTEYRTIISSLAAGANINNLRNEHIDNLSISLPPLAEQQRIAELLDTADRILKQRQSVIAKLDQLAQSVFSQIFLDAKHAITIKKLGEICDVRDGTHDSPKYVNEGIPLITSKNLSRGFIDFSDVNLISNNDFFEINKRSKVDCGDILMPMIGTIGNPVIVKDQNPNFAIKNVALIKQIPNSPNSIYLKAVLESASFKSYVEKISRGGTQKFLGLGDIRKFEISVVNKKIEDEFVNIIKKLNNMRDLYLINALKQKEMLASLQHQSFAVN